MKELSIVIVNWNVRDLLRQCLLSLHQATRTINTEIYVVDNASTDGSIEMIRTEFPEVILIANQKNFWFPKANNQALRKVKGKYTLLLNPDTTVKEDALVRLIKFMETHPSVGIDGPKILDSDGRIQYECARELPTLSGFSFSIIALTRLFPHHKIFNKEVMGNWDHQTSRFVPAISGACMLIRTKLFKKIDLLDETLPMYFEDIDLCQRANQAGAKIYYLSDAEIIHYSGQSTRKHHLTHKIVEAIQFQAYKRFFTKYRPPLNLLMFYIILITGSSLRVVTIFFTWLFLGLVGKKSDDFSLETLKKYLIALKTGLT